MQSSFAYFVLFLLHLLAREGAARGVFSLRLEVSAFRFRQFSQNLTLTTMTMVLKNIVRLALATALILLVPLVAMQFTKEVSWKADDFVLAGILLFSTGLAYQFVAQPGRNRAYRLAVGVALAAGLLLVWMNLAVGLIGSESNPLNLLYGGVLAVAIIGSLIARFRPQGMARMAFGTALTQAIVPVVALLIGRPPMASRQDVLGILGVLGVNAIFVVLWVGSGLLFRRASATSPASEAAARTAA